jgi:hypothetical protein
MFEKINQLILSLTILRDSNRNYSEGMTSQEYDTHIKRIDLINDDDTNLYNILFLGLLLVLPAAIYVNIFTDIITLKNNAFASLNFVFFTYFYFLLINNLILIKDKTNVDKEDMSKIKDIEKYINNKVIKIIKDSYSSYFFFFSLYLFTFKDNDSYIVVFFIFVIVSSLCYLIFASFNYKDSLLTKMNIKRCLIYLLFFPVVICVLYFITDKQTLVDLIIFTSVYLFYFYIMSIYIKSSILIQFIKNPDIRNSGSF